MTEWTDDVLGSYLNFRNGKTSPKRDVSGAFPVFGSNGLLGRANNSNAAANTIIIGRVGSCGSLRFSKSSCWVTDNAIICTPPHQEGKFWLYALASLGLNSYRAGSVQPLLNQSVLKQIRLRVPARTERIKIGAVLGLLDDKIDLNHRMNETLEAMARAIFKDWFVDFGPTRAKAEGRAPYLPPELWELFPDALDGEGKPVGWQGDVLGSFANLQNGYAFKSKDWRTSGVPVVKIGSVKPAFVDLDKVSFIDEALALEKGNFRLSIGDMLVGLTGYVGETGRVPPTKHTPMLNQRVGKFVPRFGLESFVYSSVRCKEFREFAESKSHGSAQANVSTKELLSYPLPNPGEPIVRAFCDTTAPLFRSSLANYGQTTVLAEVRDLLLPKLMSGEIHLRDADHVVGAVA